MTRADPGRLIVVSNRVATPARDQEVAGGLAAAVIAALRQSGGLWIGWSGKTTPGEPGPPRQHESGRIAYLTTDLPKAEFDGFYNGYANATLWPLCHYRLGLIELRRAWFEAYQRINERIASLVAAVLRPGDRVWIHDYQLMLVARELRRQGVTAPLGYFHHIPFPTPEIWTALPAHRELVESLCCHDLVGFQTPGDARAFTDYLDREAGGLVHADGRLEAFGRITRVGAFPVGIDALSYAAAARDAAERAETRRLRASLAGRRLIIGVDRLDYSKGLPYRMEGVATLFERFPEHRRAVDYLQIAPVSRGEVARYRELRRQLEQTAGEINGRYGEPDWLPVRYVNSGQPPRVLAGYFRTAKVGLVTPLRDGMNLVAKEFVASQDPEDPGILVLSRFAGAAAELGAAVIVNPFDVDRIAEALDQALRMPRDERIDRWVAMMSVVRRQDVATWWRSFLDALGEARQEWVEAGRIGRCPRSI